MSTKLRNFQRRERAGSVGFRICRVEHFWPDKPIVTGYMCGSDGGRKRAVFGFCAASVIRIVTFGNTDSALEPGARSAPALWRSNSSRPSSRSGLVFA